MKARPSDWLDTPALCQELRISRSTLSRWRSRGLLCSGQHWVRKNPTCPRSDLLWHRRRCTALLRSSVRGSCPPDTFGTSSAESGRLMHKNRWGYV